MKTLLHRPALLMIGTVVCLQLAGCASSETPSQSVPELSLPPTEHHYVTYTVTGTATDVSVVYMRGTGRTNSSSGVTLPYTKIEDFGSAGFQPSITATAVSETGANFGEVELTCRITDSHGVISENTAKSLAASVTCS